MSRLRGNIFFYGVDDEWLVSDEILNPPPFKVRATLEDGGPQIDIYNNVFKWGGECRLEVNVKGQAFANGDVQVTGVAKFFEGDSEDTNQLEDEESISFVVPATDQDVLMNYTLTNQTLQDPDIAHVNFDLYVA